GVAFDPTRAPVFQLVAGRVEGLLHGGRHPKAERITNKGAVKFFGRDADDRVLDAVQNLRSTDYVRIAAIPFLPRSITDHCDWMRIAPRPFFRSESAPQDRLHSERVEIVGGDNSPRRTLGAIADAQGRAHDPIDDERLEERGILFVIEEFGKREAGVSRDAAGGGVQGKHPVLMRDQWIRTNQDSFNP